MTKIETLELLPLAIRRATYLEAAPARYRIHRQDGSHLDVDAGTAAEAMSRSGVQDAVKIDSLAYDHNDFTTRALTSSDGQQGYETDVSDAASRPGFFLAELPPEDASEGFEEMSLEMLIGQMTAQSDNPAPAPDSVPVPPRKRRYERRHILSPDDVERLLAGYPAAAVASPDITPS